MVTCIYARPDESSNTTAALTPFSQWSDLNGALDSLRRWEEDRDRLGFGRVTLSHQNGWWIVMVTEDLYQAVLPF